MYIPDPGSATLVPGPTNNQIQIFTHYRALKIHDVQGHKIYPSITPPPPRTAIKKFQTYEHKSPEGFFLKLTSP
jgi:hypothetical protein